MAQSLQRAEAPGNVYRQKSEARLPRASVVNVSQILTVDKLDLSSRIGRLPDSALAATLSGLRLLFDGE